MPDYAAMYKKLFRSQTQAIEILQKAQQDSEEIYLSAPAPDILVWGARNADAAGTGEKSGKKKSCNPAGAKKRGCQNCTK